MRMENPDKPLVELNGTPLIELCLQKIQAQVAQVVLSVNHNQEKYAHLKLPLIPDTRNHYQGPLIGIYSAMAWIQNHVFENWYRWGSLISVGFRDIVRQVSNACAVGGRSGPLLPCVPMESST